MRLQDVALGRALGDVDHAVHEEGGDNTGEWVRKYLADVDPPINVAAPWCAAAVQYWTDRAAAISGVPNPLDAVKQEALVASYFEWAQAAGNVVGIVDVQPGDLALFNFRGAGWDHVGIVARRLDGDSFETIEGNTSPGVGATTAEQERNGDGVYLKLRHASQQPVAFVRWA